MTTETEEKKDRVREAIKAVDPEKMENARTSFDEMLAEDPVCCEHRCYCCPRTYTHSPTYEIEGECEVVDYICGGCLLLGENRVDPRRIP